MTFDEEVSPGNPNRLSGRLAWSRNGSCVGRVALGGSGTAELIVSGGTTWLKPDAAFARAQFGPAAAAQLVGKYLKGPTTDPHFAAVTSTSDGRQEDLCQTGVFLQSLPDEGDEQATKQGSVTIGGVKTVEIDTVGKGMLKTFIASEGTPYLIRGGDAPLGTVFTDYGKAVVVHVPPADQTVDVTRLPRG